MWVPHEPRVTSLGWAIKDRTFSVTDQNPGCVQSLGSCPKGRKAAQVDPQVARSNEDPVKTPPDAKVKTESGQPGSARQTQD